MSHTMKHSPATPLDSDESLYEYSRRSTPVTSATQPPPAHQPPHQSTGVPSRSCNPEDYDTPKQAHSHVPSMLTPHIPCTLAPIDLSSSISKTSSSSDSVKFAPVEERVDEKELKRRKLDKIIAGLSASKQPQPTMNMTVNNSPAPNSPPFLAQVEQYNQLMTQQQQQQFWQQQHQLYLQQQQLFNMAAAAHDQQNTFGAITADMNQSVNFSPTNSVTHEEKVSKWLAEQALIQEQCPQQQQPFVPAPKRGRGRTRVSGTRIDKEKLTGEERVTVINRLTGNKVTGRHAPQLKNLAQWLPKNPLYELDPMWVEFFKEICESRTGHVQPPERSSPPARFQTSTIQSSSAVPAANLPFSYPAPGSSGINNACAFPTSIPPGETNPWMTPYGVMPNVSTNSPTPNVVVLDPASLAGMDSTFLGNPATSKFSGTTEVNTFQYHNTESNTTTKVVSNTTPVSSSLSKTSVPFFIPNAKKYTPLELQIYDPFASLFRPVPSTRYNGLLCVKGGEGVNVTQVQNQPHQNLTSTTHVSNGSASTVTSLPSNTSVRELLMMKRSVLKETPPPTYPFSASENFPEENMSISIDINELLSPEGTTQDKQKSEDRGKDMGEQC